MQLLNDLTGLTGQAQNYLDPPANGTLPLLSKAAFAHTITGVKGLKVTAGTCTIGVQINGVGVTGLASLAVTTTSQDATATALNAVAAGDAVTLVISAVSGATGLQFVGTSTR